MMQQDFPDRFSSASPWRSIRFYMAGLLVCCVPVVMRLATICNFPSTDEGYYAFHSMLAHDALSTHGGLHPLGPLHLYPLLLNFVFSWHVNHIIALRLCDLAVSILMAWQWFRLLRQESASSWAGFFLAFFAVFAFNHPLFVQHGFKNSLGISFIFLIMALRIGLNDNARTLRDWLACGALAAMAIVFRESLAPFAVVGFLGILATQGWRASLYYAIGGMVSAFFIVACLAVARGGIINIIDGYSEFYAMARESGRLTATSIRYLVASLKNVGFLAPLAGYILLGAVCAAMSEKTMRRRFLFWMAIAAAPIFEMLTKGAYPYHYSTCLLGLSGLAACVFHSCRKFAPRTATVVTAMAFASTLFLMIPQTVDISRRMGENLQRLPAMLAKTSWPDSMVARSNYLLMAKAVTDAANPGDTLMTSGHYFLLYPLTGLLPPKTDNHLFDPGLIALARNFSPDMLKNRVIKENPDVIVLSHRPSTGADILKQALALLPQYKIITEVPIDPTRDYGGFSGSIYVKERGRAASPTD
jgi:hypothetical protein